MFTLDVKQQCNNNNNKATADDLDVPTFEPAKEGFQGGAGHRAHLIPDDHTGNECLPHPFGRPLCLTTPAEEAVIGLGLDTPGRIPLARRWVWVKTRGSLWQKSLIACMVLPLPPQCSTAGYRDAARCWDDFDDPFLYLLCSQAWGIRLHAPWACRAPRPCHATDLVRPQ